MPEKYSVREGKEDLVAPKCDPSPPNGPLTLVGNPIPEHTPKHIHHRGNWPGDPTQTRDCDPVPFPTVYSVDLQLSRPLTGCEQDAIGVSVAQPTGQPKYTPAGSVHLAVDKEGHPILDRLRIDHTTLDKVQDHQDSLKAWPQEISTAGEALRKKKEDQMAAENNEADAREKEDAARDKDAKQITFERDIRTRYPSGIIASND